MEGENKSKKVAKEKRSVKKTKVSALPVEEIAAAVEPQKAPVRKSTGTETAKGPVHFKRTERASYEQIQLRAYFIGERRKSLGILGDETSDWVDAERELSEELAAK
jgi:hypothetical protein